MDNKFETVDFTQIGRIIGTYLMLKLHGLVYIKKKWFFKFCEGFVKKNSIKSFKGEDYYTKELYDITV